MIPGTWQKTNANSRETHFHLQPTDKEFPLIKFPKTKQNKTERERETKHHEQQPGKTIERRTRPTNTSNFKMIRHRT